MDKVLMAMSGGIDSSVAAMLLTESGYDLIGATYRTFDNISQECLAKEKGCCSVDSIFEAQKMAKDMGFQHHILDIRQDFYEHVITDFIKEYMQGRTPNPCVVCNSNIKWGRLQQFADTLGCFYIATGHYARIEKTDEGRYYLRKGADDTKDQTYFLWQLKQDNLARTIFPLGSLTKNEVRSIALSHGYEKLSKKTESQEICFIPDNDYRSFLRKHVPDYDKRVTTGVFTDKNGNKLGIHQGFPNYTIGQRKGLGIALGEPAYVINIDAQNNVVTLGKKEDLRNTQCRADHVNMMKFEDFEDGTTVMAKVRYKSCPVAADIYHEPDNAILFKFHSPVESITPGQSIVAYCGENFEDVLLGAVIM